MNARATIESLVLRNVRTYGPLLLGARREVHRDARGRATPYLELGRRDGETLVFLHGFSDRPEHFLGTAAFLRGDYRILVPAMPAFGDGHVDVHAEHSLDAFGDFMTDVVAAIAPSRFHLMGNSLGGATSLAIASRIPERVATLTLVDTAGVKPRGISCLFDEFENGPNPFEVRSREDFEAFTRAVSQRPSPAFALVGNALFEEARANADWYVRLAKDIGTSVRRFYEADRDSFVDLASIAMPTLVVWGETDSFFPPAIGEYIATKVPNARFELLEGVGHIPHLEDPKRLARVFDRFAASVR